MSLSGERCTGSWVVENGKTQRPARPAFGPGTVDEVLEVPEGVVTSLNGRPVQNRPVPRPQKPVLAIN